MLHVSRNKILAYELTAVHAVLGSVDDGQKFQQYVVLKPFVNNKLF